MKQQTTTAGLLLLALIFTGAASAGQLTREGEHSADGYKRVALNADVADITIEGTDGEMITWRLEITSKDSDFLFWETEGLKADALQRITVAVSEKNDTLVLVPTVPEEFEDNNINLDWFVSAPSRLQLAIDTDVGDVVIEDMAGGAEIMTDVGDVEISNMVGKVEVRTDVGDVDLHGQAGDVEVESDVGDVTLDLKTGDIDIESDVGDVEITLPATQIKAVDLTADTGDIEVEVAGKKIPARYPEHGPGAELQKSFNSQGSQIEVRTDVGDIEIEGR
ncbi:MAG TPA: DUF4097 family beta strand repeat-containing protein [Gammaproteobacteria bacterium]|nr:DUF4097 family beta strand repeat-containing protein [Gammaproteobacteria bacterium]